jgi:hypothetical protein
MAINIPIITEFADAGLKSAQGAFANFRQQVGQAEGAMGKLKAGSGAAFDAIKANAGAMALGAGAAIATFAVKAIGQFQELALEVDKFSNATGLAAEDASRWIEVAGDIGVESGTLITSFNKLNQAIGKGSGAFEELGIEIARTSGGATDVNRTFLNTIEALRKVEDPATRARVATQLLGKSWTEVSELVEMGSTELSAALKDVSDAKVIDEAEIEKAKQFRAGMDELKDRGEDFALMVGELLVPILSDLLEIVNFAVDAIKRFGDIFGSVADFMSGDGLEAAIDQIKAVEELNDVWAEGYDALVRAYSATQDLTVGLEDVDYALEVLKGNVDDRRQWDNLITAIDDAKEAAITAFFEATPEALRESQRETDDARLKVAEYIAQMEGIPLEKKTEMIAALDKANLDEIEKTFNHLSRTRNVTFRIRTVGGVEVGAGETPSEVRRSLSLRSSTPNVTVNVGGSVIAERDLVENIRKGLVDSQRNGNQLVYTNR